MSILKRLLNHSSLPGSLNIVVAQKANIALLRKRRTESLLKLSVGAGFLPRHWHGPWQWLYKS